jgi:hypothetical protein
MMNKKEMKCLENFFDQMDQLLAMLYKICFINFGDKIIDYEGEEAVSFIFLYTFDKNLFETLIFDRLKLFLILNLFLILTFT